MKLQINKIKAQTFTNESFSCLNGFDVIQLTFVYVTWNSYVFKHAFMFIIWSYYSAPDFLGWLTLLGHFLTSLFLSFPWPMFVCLLFSNYFCLLAMRLSSFECQ